MLFNSYQFLFLFLPLTFIAYWKAPAAIRKAVLVGSSYVFYSVWSLKFSALMLLTTGVDFFTAQRIDDSHSSRKRRGWLALSMVCNLGVLATFKYYDFFATSTNELLHTSFLPLIHVALPIGISFYTFESMSYTIDVYRREVPSLRSFVDYAHFVTMFPRLVAGPIVRYRSMASQLRDVPHALADDHVVEAVHMFTVGLAKKVLIADFIASRFVDPLFGADHPLGLFEAWIAAIGYTVQLYMDFSGYSDMAVGLALLFGFRLPRNFNLPYRSANVSEFWRRWHISLSSWLRDYLYIPLGGNRGGRMRTSVNLFATMVLGGLWHGANWTFVLWGVLHGAALVAYNTGAVRAPWMPRWMAIATTFGVVVVGWVMFRADTLSAALAMYQSMAGQHGLGLTFVRESVPALGVLSIALALSFTVDTYDVLPLPTRLRWALVEAIVLVICLMRLAVPSPFLYFQF